MIGMHKIAVIADEFFPYFSPVEQIIAKDGPLYREIELTTEELTEWDKARNEFEKINEKIQQKYYATHLKRPPIIMGP